MQQTQQKHYLQIIHRILQVIFISKTGKEISILPSHMDMTGNCNHYAKSPLRRAFSLYTKRKRTKGGTVRFLLIQKRFTRLTILFCGIFPRVAHQTGRSGSSIPLSVLSRDEVRIISSSCRIISSITADSKISFMFFLP